MTPRECPLCEQPEHGPNSYCRGTGTYPAGPTLLGRRFVLRPKPTPISVRPPQAHACGTELKPLFPGSTYARCAQCNVTVHIRSTTK